MGKIMIKQHDKDDRMLELWEVSNTGVFLIASITDEGLSEILTNMQKDRLGEKETLTFRLVEVE